MNTVQLSAMKELGLWKIQLMLVGVITLPRELTIITQSLSSVVSDERG